MNAPAREAANAALYFGPVDERELARAGVLEAREAVERERSVALERKRERRGELGEPHPGPQFPSSLPSGERYRRRRTFFSRDRSAARYGYQSSSRFGRKRGSTTDCTWQ